MASSTAFDSIATIYHWLMRFSGAHKTSAAAIRSAITFSSTDRVLDVGGGTGLIAGILASDVGEITVLDPSQNMLSHVSDSRIQTVQGTAQQMPFESASFDVVYCVDAFHHFTNDVPSSQDLLAIQQALSELFRVLKPDGTMVFVEFDPTVFRGRLIQFFENTVLRLGSRFLSPTEFHTLFDPKNTSVEVMRLKNSGYLAVVKRTIDDV